MYYQDVSNIIIINLEFYFGILTRQLKCKLATAANRETFYQITIKEKNDQLDFLYKSIQAIELSDSDTAKYVKFIVFFVNVPFLNFFT